MSGGQEKPQQSPNEPAAIKHYAELKSDVLRCIDTMSVLEQTSTHGPLYGELREKIETDTFNLVVVGQFKRGKTCLINALLGADLLPVAVVPLTSIGTILAFGDSLTVSVFFNDGRKIEVGPDQLADYVTETGNPRNEKDVREVHLTYPSPYLKNGVRLIDTPGVGSAYVHNTDVAYQYLPRCDAALFLLSVEQPVSQAEIDFLKDVRQFSHRIFFLLNKIDTLSQTEMEESAAFSNRIIRETVGTDVQIFPVSARLAMEGRGEAGTSSLERSRLPAFQQVLDHFLLAEKGKVLLLSSTGHLLRILSQSRLETELELKSLTVPLEELEDKIRAFQVKKQETLLEKRSFDPLLESELNKLIKNVLEEDLHTFMGTFAAQIQEQFDAFYEGNRELPLKELDEKLDGFIAEEIQRGCTTWRAAEDAKLSGAFGELCSRFMKKMDEIVDSLLTFSSELFAVPFEAVTEASIWTNESGFYYKLKEDPAGLEMLSTSLTHALPGLVHSRFKKLRDYLFNMAYRRIYNKRKQQLLQTIDLQAGRIRYDFVERLNKSKGEFRRKMLLKSEATVEGIGLAIEKGMNRRDRGEKEAERRRTALLGTLQEMDEVRAEIVRIRESASGM